MFKFLKNFIERIGSVAPMPIILPPLMPHGVVIDPPVLPVEETPKPKRAARNQPKPSVRKKLKKAE